MTSYQKYLLLSLTVAFLSAVLLVVFFISRYDHTDTFQYVSTIENIAGNNSAELFPYRLLKPLPILISVAFYPILTPVESLVVQNIFFYFLSVWLIFLLIYRIYNNEKQAFYGSVLYVGSYPMIAYGLAPLTDMSGWFFFLLSAIFAIEFSKKPESKTVILSGLTAGFGMLFKENVAAAPIFFASLTFIATRLSLKDKIRYLLVFGMAFAIFPIINSIVLYYFYSYSYFHAFRLGGIHPEGASGFYIVSTTRIIIEIGRVLLFGWVLFLLGILKEFAEKNIERIKILASFVPPSLSVFLWCYPHNRMIFIAFPLLFLLSSLGVLRNNKSARFNIFIEAVLVFGFVLVNYIILELLLNFGESAQPHLSYE